MSIQTQNKDEVDAARESKLAAATSYRTFNQIITDVTRDYIADFRASGKPKPLFAIEAELMQKTNAAIAISNMHLDKGEGMARLRTNLATYQIAELAREFGGFVRITPSLEDDSERDMLAIYQSDRGVYTSDPFALERGVHVFAPSLSSRGVVEVLGRLNGCAKRVVENENPDLVPMRNGIFNYRTKELTPFSPEFVFTSKLAVDYVPRKQHPTLFGPDGEVFNFDEWLLDLMDGHQGNYQLLLEIIGAVLRGGVPWDKLILFYDSHGANGKGTVLELLRNLVGPGNAVSLPIRKWGNDFMLEPLTKAYAVLTDENAVGSYLDDAENLKAAVTHDVLMINRKGRVPISYKFKGAIVQCANALPVVRDKSNSLVRRLLIVPFRKTFAGKTKPWIKAEMMQNRDLLEYVAHKVLTEIPNYYKLSTTDGTDLLLDQFVVQNDPIVEFWREFSEEFVWTLVPNAFLYDLFVAWHHKGNPNGSVIGRNKFLSRIQELVEEEEWSWTGWTWQGSAGDSPISASKHIVLPEPLILEYDLEDWKSRVCPGSNPDLIRSPAVSGKKFRGIVRTNALSTNDLGETD